VALERDVRCGCVSKDAAETFYGAVFEPDALAIDAAATATMATATSCGVTPKAVL
jgi:hypothetical protein